jgi:uncharacterized protein YecT (DUF1311 family)
MRWRTLAVLLLLTSLAAADAFARPPRLAPPVIREEFTPLPCPRKPAARGATVGQLGCAEQKILRTDAQINARTKVIFARLDVTGKRLFLAAERAWLAYRKASCDSVADSYYRGGSERPVLFAVCVAERNVQHLKELRAFQNLLRPR